MRSALLTLALLMTLTGCEGTMSGERDTPERPFAPGAPSPGESPEVVPAYAPGPRVLARLSARQHRNAMRALLGAPSQQTSLEVDTNPYLFYSIGSTTTDLSAHGVELYSTAARAHIQHVFSDPARRAALLGCTPAALDDLCAQSFLSDFGRRAYRRPLTPQELERWTTTAQLAGAQEVWQGLALTLQGMLQSPYFLYRVEVGEPSGEDGWMRYTSGEMASRLAFLLWNAPPDDTLLELGERGALLDEETLRAQAVRMLEDPRAREAVQDFFSQYLALSKLDGITRDTQKHPWFTPTLAAAMKQEVRLLVDDAVFRRDADIRELFSAPRSFVNSELAEHYAIEAPGASTIAYVPVTFAPDSPRAGILTLGAFLTLNATPERSSPTIRGKYLRERVLCQDVPLPPDNVDLGGIDDEDEAAPSSQPQTLRERLERHRDDPQCAGCHAFIDPPGHLFEHFDATGRYQLMSEGLPIDSSGALDGVPLKNARELAEHLASSERVAACMVKQLYRHAQGRLEDPGERESVLEIEREFAASGYRFKALVLALVTSRGFRTFKEVSP